MGGRVMTTPRKRPGEDLLLDPEMHLLSPDQVAELLCVSRPVLRKWVTQGLGPAPIMIKGRVIGYFRADVYEFIRTSAEEARREHERVHAAWVRSLPEAEPNDEEA